jgi:hypothetical protein
MISVKEIQYRVILGCVHITPGKMNEERPFLIENPGRNLFIGPDDDSSAVFLEGICIHIRAGHKKEYPDGCEGSTDS